MVFPTEYEKRIVSIMIDDKLTLVEAMTLDFGMNYIDCNSVFDMVDYLENETLGDLDKVEWLMNVYTGKSPNMKLRPITDEKSKT